MWKSRARRIEETGGRVSVGELCDTLQRHYCYCVPLHIRATRALYFTVAFNVVKRKSRVSRFRATLSSRKYVG